MDLASIEKMLVAGKNHYRAFADAEAVIKALSGQKNYASELEARVEELSKKTKEAEMYLAAIEDKNKKLQEEGEKILLEAKLGAAELIAEAKKSTADILSASRNEVKEFEKHLQNVKAEHAELKKQIAENRKQLSKLESAKADALKALGM